MDVTPKMEADLAEETKQALLAEYGDRLLSPEHPIAIYVTSIISAILEGNNLGYVAKSSLPGAESASDSGSSSSQSRQMTAERSWGDDVDVDEINVETEMDTRPGTAWNVLVVDDPSTVNAMATFGHIIVFTGLITPPASSVSSLSPPSSSSSRNLNHSHHHPNTDDTDPEAAALAALPPCPTPSALAGVLAHEIAHITLRHASESLSLTRAIGTLQLLLEALGLDFGLGRIMSLLVLECVLLLSWLSSMLVLTGDRRSLPNSRRQETEADALGMKYSAKACFDPGEMPG
jgi:hypothetical protein